MTPSRGGIPATILSVAGEDDVNGNFAYKEGEDVILTINGIAELRSHDMKCLKEEIDVNDNVVDTVIA